MNEKAPKKRPQPSKRLNVDFLRIFNIDFRENSLEENPIPFSDYYIININKKSQRKKITKRQQIGLNFVGISREVLIDPFTNPNGINNNSIKI